MTSLPELTTEIRSSIAATPELRDHVRLIGHIEERVLTCFPLATPTDRQRHIDSLLAELVGLGPLDELLRDEDVDEVLVNAGSDIWVERYGHLRRVGALPDGQVEVLLERILTPLGRRVDRMQPIVDARLPDGSRISAVIPPLAVDGTCLSIRRFRRTPVRLDGFMTDEAEQLVGDLIDRRLNIIISGATSTGKTTLLNALATRIASNERIITVEDVAELRLGASHVVRLECRPATAEGAGAATMRDLVRSALRLRPDRLVVGEVRGAEALDMVQAMNTGHDGSISTCHANGPLDALRRLESMIMQAADAAPLTAIREQLHSSIDVIIHVTRFADGARRVSSIAEVSPVVDDPRIRWLVRGNDVIGEPLRSRVPTMTDLGDTAEVRQ